MERTLKLPGISDDSAASLAELLRPVHDFTEAHGISEEEIQHFFEQQLAKSRREPQRAGDSGRFE